MDFRDVLEECCSYINSSRVTERKKYCEKLSNLLEKKDVVQCLNDGICITWKQILSAVQDCLRKDADKTHEDAKKKGATVKYPSSDLFIQVVKTALRDDADNLDIPGLIGYIIGCMRDFKMKTSYDNMFVHILHEYIVPNPKCRGKFDCDNWTDLYLLLKKLCKERPNDIWIYKCLMLTIKFGPLSGFPPLLFREQFNYITALCQAITPSSPRPQQENLLEIAIYFCKHTVKDNRISCCKFGENVFPNLISLYEQNGKEAKIKEQLIEFLYLQLVIHQPNGVYEGHPCAYADDWVIWRRCLKIMYSLLSKEIHFYFQYRQKNTSFFSINGELTTLSDEFLNLFVEVSRQVFMSPYLDVTQTVDNIFTIQDSQKRQKIDISLNRYIKNIEETKCWLWINIVCVIIQRYTELLDLGGYLDLLNILSTIQIETSDYNTIDKVYVCLSVLADISNIDTSSNHLEIDKLWKIIGENTTRAFGLNQHKEATEILLEKLIVKGTIDSDTILLAYSSGMLNISLQSINILETTLLYVHFLKLDASKQEILINCILNPQNLKDYNYLLYKKTADFLVKLTLKQWQVNKYDENEEKICEKYSDVKKIYRLSLFKENVLQPENHDKVVIERNYTFDESILNLLIRIIENFIQHMPNSIEIILSVIVLLVNILSCMVDYKIVKEAELNSFQLTHILRKLFSDDSIQNFEKFRNKDEREIKKLLSYIKILDRMFSLKGNVLIMKEIRNLVPFQLLASLTIILNDLQEEHRRNSEIKFELKKAILKTMSSFCCIGVEFLNENQNNLLEVISTPSYNCNLEDDYVLLLTFLKTFKYAKAGVISNEIFNGVLNSVQEVCVARYQCAENATEILGILYDLYPHLALSVDNKNQILSVALLKPFYENRNNYGPDVSVALLKCFDILIKEDPQNKFSFWSDGKVIRFVPEFLCSDYQEVRFKAIETLVTFFQVNSQSKELQNFHRQEEIFSKIYDMSLKVFEISDELSNEHKTDEIISRTASVLQTFIAIMINCNIWIEECLFALVKLSSKKKIKSVDEILLIITEHFMKQSEINVMEKYLERILERWLNEGYYIEDFQFKLFNCSDKSDFYLKYFELCVPFLMVRDRKDLILAAKHLQLTERDIVEKTCSKIFSHALCKNVDSINEELIKSNNILAYYTHIVGLDELKRLLVNDLENILLIILHYLTDEMYIQDNLGETVIFLTKHLSIVHITTCFRFIEEFLCENLKIPEFLTEQKLSKLQKMLLALQSNIYRYFTDDDRIKALHRYTFFINLVTENLKPTSSWQDFFVRDTIYGLINLITNQEKFTNFTRATCRFLTTYVKKIVPTFSETFEKFLTFTTNALTHFVMTNSTTKKYCLEILQFLIVENSCYLVSGIEKLDNFPQHKDFEKIYTVHRNIKYGSTEASLKQEIDFFLEHGDLSTRQDSLIHLKNVLANKKMQLKEMYDKLQVRGFSEDCKNSAIHRLICSLAKLSSSPDEMVSFQALNCLGELGPANLMTLVLQPERTMSDQNWLPFDLLTCIVISLLSGYIVDSNIKVVEVASDLLYVILDWKESRKIAQTEKDFGYGPIHKKYIYPYFPLVKSSPSSTVAVDTNLFVSKIANDQLWYPSKVVTHKEWIVSLVSSLLEMFTNRSYLSKLVPICKVKPKFAEQILPLIINLLLFVNNKDVVEILSLKIDKFFSLHWQNMVPKCITTKSITVNKKSVKCMLNVLSVVRLQRCYNLSKARFVGNLEIDYLKVAKAAEFCAAHFTALLYSDLWCQTIIEDMQNKNKTYCEQRSTMLDIIYENVGEEIGEALQNILRNAYKAVGDLDALPGCGISFLLKPQSRVEHYKELGKWDQVTHFYAMQFHGLHSNAQDLMESFKNCSLYQIPLLCTQQFDEPPYECLWRLGQWNTINKRQITKESIVKPDDFEKYRYYALNSLIERNQCSFEDFKKSECLCIIEDLKHTSLESSQNVYPILSRLQSIVEMEDFAKGCDSRNFIQILKKWDLQKELVTKNDYHYFEPIVAQRISMLKDYLKLHRDDNLKNYLVDMTLDLANLAKDEGFFKEGLTVLEQLKSMSGLSGDVRFKIQLMDAQLSWLINDKLVARHILNTLCKSDVKPKLKATALKLLGQYMSETYSENRFTIIRNYFMESLALMKELERTEEDFNSILDTYDKLAQFADREYQQIMMYMKSDLFQRKIKNMEKAKQEASSIQKQRQKTHDETKAATIHNRQSSIDQTEINNTKQECNQLLVIALKFYLLNLYHCESNNIKIFRIISLFLENRNNPEISKPINSYLSKVSSYKYIIMLPQLIPHVTESSSDLFSQKVNEIVEKCAIEHPHHTLPLLLSLANSNKDKEFTSQKTKTLTNDARVAMANKLLAKLKRQGKLKDHINKLQQLAIALIDLAYKDIDTSDRKSQYEIPRNQKIMKIQNFDDILLPTYNLRINIGGNYSQIVGITGFANVYHPVGGINHPKRIKCRGTDGKEWSQLVKGHDDLRQDAVMEQVFNIMNNLLSSNKQTRNLLIRTYKIVPLSMRSGILEWVDDSMPIGMYLVGEDGKSGAHLQYRSNDDRTPTSCKELFKRCVGKSAEEKQNIYNTICQSFKPVFHKFFESSFPQPTIWYERRRAYIYSVATTSMCGYVLGIGDRHVSNILIDKTTAEVVHIDFGIAFEQGKVLPTPETVPFRLTRDIVDGMGPSGVEGLFRRSCEKTMEVLRQNAQTIITILEVLLYDPLYAWTVTSAEANRRQTDEDFSNVSPDNGSDEEHTTVNITAERALLRLREKLQGTELGHPTSIEHQVGTLIQQAIDPANLCKLYFGWQPYL